MPRATNNSEEAQAIIERLKPLAARQGGILHRRQFLAEGVSPDQLLRWKARGWIEPRFRWTYAFPGTGSSLITRSWSAMLSVGGDAAISHRHALVLQGVLPEVDGPLHCLLKTGSPRPQAGLVVHKTDYLLPADVIGVEGIRCAAFHRAMLSMCEKASASEIDRALDSGVHLRLFQSAAFERMIGAIGNAPGREALEAALGRLNETAGRNRSELERRLTELIVNSHLPNPIVNAIIGGREVDNHWIKTRAIVEADGRSVHSSPADLARDTEKQRALEALGYVILRLTWHQVVYEPERTLERIEAFLKANREPPVPRKSAA